MVCLDLRIIVLNEISQIQVTNIVVSLMFGIERKTKQNSNKTRTWQEEGLLFGKREEKQVSTREGECNKKALCSRIFH